MPRTDVEFDISGRVGKIRFKREQPEFPETVVNFLKKDLFKKAQYKTKNPMKDPVPKGLDVCHIISKEFIYKYWQKNLRGREVSEADQIVKARIEELLKEAKEVKGYKPQKKYIDPTGKSPQEQQKILEQNIEALIYLELTAHKNLYLGDSKRNQKFGGEIGITRTALDKAYREGGVSSRTVHHLKEKAIDLGDDDKKEHWGMSPEKITAARERFDEIFKISLGLIEDNPKSFKYDPKGEIPRQSLPSYTLHLEDAEPYEAFKFYVRNPNFQNMHGNTFLHLAVGKGETEFAEALLQNQSVKVDMQNNDGNTPLHLAAKSGNIELVKLLIDRGANPYIVNDDDLSPFHLATPGNDELIKLLDPEGVYHSREDEKVFSFPSSDFDRKPDDSIELDFEEIKSGWSGEEEEEEEEKELPRPHSPDIQEEPLDLMQLDPEEKELPRPPSSDIQEKPSEFMQRDTERKLDLHLSEEEEEEEEKELPRSPSSDVRRVAHGASETSERHPKRQRLDFPEHMGERMRSASSQNPALEQGTQRNWVGRHEPPPQPLPPRSSVQTHQAPSLKRPREDDSISPPPSTPQISGLRR